MLKKFLFSLLFLILPIGLILAQDNQGGDEGENDIGKGEITYEENFISLTYYRYGREIGHNIVAELMKDHRSATELLETSELKREFATIAAGAGVAAIVYAATTSFNEGFNWGVFAAGAGVIGVGTYLYKDSKDDAKEAIRIYNNSLPDESESGMTLKMGITSAGVGFTLSF